MIKIQPAPFVDHVTGDGQELTKLPYPLFFNEDGTGAGDGRNGMVVRAIGFQRDPDICRIDVPWRDAVTELGSAVGLYLVSSDKSGAWGTHTTPVQSAELLTQ